MWFKHRAWIPVAWILSFLNIAATWFAAQPAETWHATTHALLAVVFGVGAERLAARQRALRNPGGTADTTALGQSQAEILKRVEQAVEAMAVELERVGEGQRFITKVLTDPSRSESIPLLRRPPHEER